MTRSITIKLILAFLMVSVTGVAIASGITYWLTVSRFKQLVFNQARDRVVANAALYYEINGSWDGVTNYFTVWNASPFPANQEAGPIIVQTGPGGSSISGPGSAGPKNLSFIFVLTDANGKVLVTAGQYQPGEVVPRAKLAQGTKVEVNGKQVGTVLTIGSTPPLGGLESQYLTRTNQALLYAALGSALLALVLGILLARTLTHPLRDLTAAIHAMAAGDLKQHVQVKSRDELGDLAAAFNQMSDDLDRLNQSRRQMTADIAHDLRTPLTVIGGYIESMRDGVLKPTRERLDTINSEVQHLQRLVEDLRTLSQADAGELSLNREPVDPAALLERMAKSYGPLAARQKVSMDVKADGDLPSIRLDADRMAQVFANLVTNSLRYTPEGGNIHLTAGLEADALVLGVQDDGQGIPAESLPHIFDRFYRGDRARSAGNESGLGLTIARSIVEVHGGKITAESRVGQGTTIKMKFPVSG